MGLLKGILIYKYATRRANKKRDHQEAREQAALEQELCELELQGGSWAEEICEYCGRTNEEHLEDEEPCS